MKTYRSILITGASSGIGEALALAYAAPGVRLALNGRDEARLDAVAAACRARGAETVTGAIDVSERAAMVGWVEATDDAAPLDLVVANAGVGLEFTRPAGDDEATRRTFEINVEGTFNTVLPLIPRFRARRAGQIAVVASLASFVGLPYGAAYNASKAAQRVWGESLRIQLKRDGIGVSVICPGFVRTRLTEQSKHPRPFLMEVDRAAEICKRGLARNQARIAFPAPTKSMVWLAGALPGNLTARLLGG